MAEDRIRRKKLWQSLGNIKRQIEWLQAAEKLGLTVTGGGGKGSHWAIRNGKYPISDIRSLVATVQKGLHKKANEKIFKHLLDEGVSEDDIWKALGML